MFIINKLNGWLCLILIVAAASLTACGKRGAPQPPLGEPDTYPGQYPMPEDD